MQKKNKKNEHTSPSLLRLRLCLLRLHLSFLDLIFLLLTPLSNGVWAPFYVQSPPSFPLNLQNIHIKGILQLG